MFDALLSLWPLWSFALASWVLLKLGRVWYLYRKRMRRL